MHMSKSFSKFYRNMTQSILDKIVTPQVLGNTAELEQSLAQHTQNNKVCYVLEDASLSNTVLIDQQALARGLPSVFSALEIDPLQDDDCLLALNQKQNKNQSYHYPEKLIRLIEYLEQHTEVDIQLVPVSVLWGRAPQYEDSWVKALFADAWSKPNKIKQSLNISLYGRDNYIEFHKSLSLRKLLTEAKDQYPNFSPAHYISDKLDQNFNNYKEAVLGPDLSDRHNLIYQLLKTEAVQNAILQESIAKNISVLTAENLAQKYLLEIVSDFSYSTLRFAELALTKLWTQLYDGIEVHNFDTVRELAKDYQIVYTPCHRSHIDYLLLSYVIFNRGLMVPHIAAGINLNLPLVGQIMRGGGAYFIRRSFNGNKLYTSVFKEYLNSLISRNTPLEYFIEGGRSRTGLLLPAKKGMLAMTVESHLRANNKPIVFIPTYFGYEKLIEGTAYLNELNGKPKEAESLWGIFNSIRKIEKVFGQVHVNFADPIFLDPILAQHKAENISLTAEDKPPLAVINSVNQVAQEILENINQAVVITPISLISLILLHSPDCQLEKAELVHKIDLFRQLLQHLKYHDRMMLTQLSSSEIIEYAEKLKQIDVLTPTQRPLVRVADRQKILLNYFSNNILHCLILASSVAKLVQSHSPITQTQIIQHIEKIYPFLQTEFFLHWQLNEIPTQIMRILNEFQQQVWISQNGEQICLAANANMQQVADFNLLASLCQLSFNNFILIEKLIHHYSDKIDLDLKTLELMAKAVIKRLIGHPALQNNPYFDSASVKSFSQCLEQLGYIQLNQGIIQCNHDLMQQAHDSFQWYMPEIQQVFDQSLFFTDRELQHLKDDAKRKK